MVSWTVTPEKIQAAIQKIISIGTPRKVIEWLTHADSTLRLVRLAQ